MQNIIIFHKFLEYMMRKNGNSGYLGVTNRECEVVATDEELKDYLKNRIWRWYLEYVEEHKY